MIVFCYAGIRAVDGAPTRLLDAQPMIEYLLQLLAAFAGVRREQLHAGLRVQLLQGLAGLKQGRFCRAALELIGLGEQHMG